MARQVTGTANNALNVLTGEAIPYPFTISCRFRTPVQQANCTPIFYGETYPSWDGDYVSISSTGIGASTGKAANFFGAALTVSLVPNRWYLVVCVFASSTSRTIYLDNSTQTTSNASDSGPPLNTNKNFTVGSLLTAAFPSGLYPAAGFDGEIADVAIHNTAFTGADVDKLAAGRPGNVKLSNLKAWWKLGADGSLANSVGSYGPMVVNGTCPVTADPAYNALADPAEVPDGYVPNTSLSWVNKATHIWALHPDDPLRADKGGSPLTLEAGTAPTVFSDNTMEFKGAGGGYYHTISSFIFGDDPVTAGNQTPPAIGGCSFWLNIYGDDPGGNYSYLTGQVILGGVTPFVMAFYGDLYSVLNGLDYIAGGAPFNTWLHVAFTNDATWRRTYVNGVKVSEVAQDSLAGAADQWYIGRLPGRDTADATILGRMRLVSVINGAVWTDAEILEQYERPYAYYTPDPTSVPTFYKPNTDLAWVTKATHIWALHPSNPLKADKGGLTLGLVTGTQPVPTAQPDNTMQFYGGAEAASSGYRSPPFIFGTQEAPPDVSGSTVGSISCWVYLDSYPGNRTRLVGGVPLYYAPALSVFGSGLVVADIASPMSSVVPVLPLGQWTHIAITSNGTFQKIYANGVLVRGAASPTWGMSNVPLDFGCGVREASASFGLVGRMRLVAIVDGAEWTDAEIAEQAARPYAYYKPDPTHVPDTYSPNTDLAWVQKATHIWALHPADPLKADKGGMTLQQVGSGPYPTAVPSPENVMQFPGGVDGSGGWYQTVGTLIYGDDPNTAGNQTPPAIGGFSAWFKLSVLQQYTTLMGGSIANFAHTPLAFFSNALCVNYTGPGLCYGGTTGVVGNWVHLAFTSDGTNQHVYVNGVLLVTAGGASNNIVADVFNLGWAGFSASGNNYAINGQMRLAAMICGQLWTDAEILEQYQRPYAYYSDAPAFTGIHAEAGAFALAGQPATLRVARKMIAESGQFLLTGSDAGLRAARKIVASAGAYKLAGDNISTALIPDSYVPNTALPWVQKSTHIWAVHPSDPLRADKGGLTLELVTNGTGIPPTAMPDNTMEFHGGLEANSSFYRTIGTMIWGDDPNTAGNQTPPMVGSMSAWINVYSWIQWRGIAGGDRGATSQTSAHMGVNANGAFASHIGGIATGGQSPNGSITRFVWRHVAVTADGTLKRLYVDGVKVQEYPQEVIPGPSDDIQWFIGRHEASSASLCNTMDGRIRLVAVANGAVWTDAEILDQAQNPYAYYVPPSGVPATYTPNLSLPWAQKATHIWAVHPSDPLKADKGGNNLELVSGTPAPPSAFSDNTMEFHGHSTANSGSYYRTSAPMIFGDNPAVAGNQTPPAIGAFSAWVQIYDGPPANWGALLGQESWPNAMTTYYSAGARGLRFDVGGVNTGAGSPLPLQWQHVCGTNDGTFIRLYFNGVKVKEFASNTTNVMTNEKFNIGWGTDFSGIGSRYGFNGRIRLVAVVNGATWTDAEILDQYQNPYAYYAAPRWETILKYGRKLFGEAGVFALDGQPVDLRTTRYLQAGGGEFLITGYDAELKHWMPVKGSGRIYYVAKDDRIVYIPGDGNVTETP